MEEKGGVGAYERYADGAANETERLYSVLQKHIDLSLTLYPVFVKCSLSSGYAVIKKTISS
jgi:hypothetical protein